MKTWLVLTLIILAVTVRVVDLGTHMSHHDELSVARNIKLDYNYDKLEEYSDKQAFISILPEGLKQPLFTLVNTLPFTFMKMAVTTTYAPLQFFLTQFFLIPTTNYQGTLILGRLVSVIIGVFSIFLLYIIMEKKPESYLSMTVMACSWTHIIASKTMYNYVSGPLAVLILMFLLTKNLKAVWLGVISILLVLLHYQTIMFLPAFLLALALRDHSLQEIIKKPWLLKREIIAGGIALIGILPLYYIKLNTILTLHWSAGPHGEYALAGHNPFSFFITNGWIVLQNLFSFAPENTLLMIVISILLLTSTLASLKFVKETPVLFSVISIVIIGVFIIMGKLALGPTRHLLILLPVLAFLAGKGFQNIQHTYLRHIMMSIVIIFILLSFILNAHNTYSQREEIFNEKEFTQLLEDYHVGTIIADSSTIQPLFVKKVQEEYTYSYTPKQNMWQKNCTECSTLIISTYERLPPTNNVLYHYYDKRAASQEYSNRTISTTNTLEIVILKNYTNYINY